MPRVAKSGCLGFGSLEGGDAIVVVESGVEAVLIDE